MRNEQFWREHPEVYNYIKDNYQNLKDFVLSTTIRERFKIDIASENIRYLRRMEGWKKRVSTDGKSIQKNESPSNISEQDLRQALSEKGYRVEKITPDKMDIKKRVDTSMFEGETIKFGVISCTHLCSKYMQLTYLHTYYKHIQEQGIKLVLHAGDVVAGIKVYKGQEYELFLHGEKAQREYVIEHYPRMENGGKTIMIAGNHDYSFVKEAGCDIVENIADKREDIEYWGAYGAYPILPRLKTYIQHTSGGVPYALCFDDKTEVLTHRRGWQLIKELNENDEVATLNKKSYLEWQKPTAKFEYNWDNYLLHFKARSFDLMVTPNHNMFVRRYPGQINRLSQLTMPQKSHQRLNTNWQLIEAQNLFNEGTFVRQKWQLSKEMKWKGKTKDWYVIPRKEKRKYSSKEPQSFEKINMDLWLGFLGWYIAEGHTHGKNAHKYATTLTQQNLKGRKEIIKLLKQLKWDYKLHGNKKITIYGGQLAEHLDDICGVGAKNKKAPSFIKDLSPKQIKIFLETALRGDGSKGMNQNWLHYTTYSKRLKDDIQELFLKCGIGATITKRGCSLSYYQNLPTINKKPDKVRYKGKVYCIEVPNHIILVRRNGRAIWSGNSYRLQKNIEQFSPDAKPDIYFMGHLHKSCALFQYRNVTAFSLPCFESQTPYLRRKGLYPEIGGLIVEFFVNDKGRKDNLARMKFEWVPFYKPIEKDY